MESQNNASSTLSASSIGIEYIAYCRRRFLSEYFPRIQECLSKLSDEQIWWRPNEESNSIGNLILHLCGNVSQWIISGLGGADDVRNRPLEFSEEVQLNRSELLKKIQETLNEADSVLAVFDSALLMEKRTIQHYELTCLDALSHVVEHFGQHTAQIIYITKLLKGSGLEQEHVIDFFASYFPDRKISSTP